MARTLAENILDAFRTGDLDATKDALAWAIDRAAHQMAEGNRQRLSDLWHTLSGVHYKVEGLPLSEGMAEQRGYLEAIVHLTHAVRDLSDDLEAIQKVRSCGQGPAILRKIKEEGTVRHGALAQSLGISAPSLTQTIGALAPSGTITSTVHGKFKYYSLTPLGTLVARKIEGVTTLAESLARMKATIESRLGGSTVGASEATEPRGRLSAPFRRGETSLAQAFVTTGVQAVFGACWWSSLAHLPVVTTNFDVAIEEFIRPVQEETLRNASSMQVERGTSRSFVRTAKEDERVSAKDWLSEAIGEWTLHFHQK